MSKIIGKISRLPKTLYEHKKKTIFFSFLGYLGADWVYRWERNQGIRQKYAQLAVQFGEKTVSPEDRPKRIFVLVNVEGNSRSCFDAFNKNALPLFHLAGVQVDVVKADNEAQMEALAGAVDTQEADVLYVVGGDGTIGKVVTGIFRNRDKAAIPVGFYPGGYDNLWLKRMVPSVFESSEDVRHACETAMAVIEDQKRSVCAFEMRTDDEQPEYGLSDVSAGWFRQCEDTRKKIWYFSLIKRRWAYFWEMLKRSPSPIECHVEYEETCSGCEKCRPKPVVVAPTWRWWHVLTGTPKYKNNEAERDFTGIVNEKCGVRHELEAKGVELLIENEQSELGDFSQLRFRMGGSDAGRFGVVADGWKRCSEGVVGRSTDDAFYSTDFQANSVTFKLSALPTYIHRLYVSSIPTPKDAELLDKKVTIRGTQKRLEVFLPTALRFDL